MLEMIIMLDLTFLSFGIVGGFFSVACSMETRFMKAMYYMNYVIFFNSFHARSKS